MMKVLFSEEVASFETVKSLRAEKRYFLERFQEEGFYLMHGFDHPLPNTTSAARSKIYRENVPHLIQNILEVAAPVTPIVLISAVVFQGIGTALKQSGFRVIHPDMIEFPNSGQQLNFRRKLKPLLRQEQLLPDLL